MAFVLVLGALASFHIVAAAPPSSGGIVVDSIWRFTAVTDRLIRIEHDDKKQFVDERTSAFLRSTPIGEWGQRVTDGGWTVLNTSKVSVRYRHLSNGGSVGNGDVSVISRFDGTHVWTWGDDPEPGNLRGTARTLDSGAETLDLNCHKKVSPTMDNSQEHCTWGLVSRKGWAMVDETGAPIMVNDWFAPSRNSTDVSIFMHGLDYTGALTDFFYAAGPPSLPPRSALGTIFTRWFDFDQDKVINFVNDFESRSMPLDTWIFDMNWHIYGPWGAFTWNQDSFPQVQDMLDWFQKKGLPIGANTHGHGGITTQEKTYDEVCKALGCTPGKDIPFDLYNKSYAMAQEDIAVRALDTKNGTQGIDFSWIDYQQGETDQFEKTKIPNINPTIVLNTLRSTDPQRHGEDRRGLVLSRWGGLGNHRYPLGFSGDQDHTWKGLAYLPYFTSTAANVAFNYWSHDTVGGQDGSALDHELSVRWVQTSAWSPVLRFHDKGAGTGGCATTDTCARVVPWDVPTAFFEAIREASQVRDQLMPYIYTAAFLTESTGLALTRPMYYENPADDAMYSLTHQYLFGPNMIISPISLPSGPDTAKGFGQAIGAVQWSVFAPATGKWVDRLNGDFFSGASSLGVYGIKDVPGFVRQGAVVPMRPHLGGSWMARAVKSLEAVEFRIMPAEAFYSGGDFKASGVAIDDDGTSLGYQRGEFTQTTCDYTFSNGTFTIKVGQSGDFKGRPTSATLRFSFTQLPPMVMVDNGGHQFDVTYDHALLGSVFTLQNVDLTKGTSVKISLPQDYTTQNLQQFVGVLGRVRRARYAKDALDLININYGTDRCNLTAFTLTAVHMSPAFVGGLSALWDDVVQQVSSLHHWKSLINDKKRFAFVSAMVGLQNATELVSASIMDAARVKTELIV